MIQPNNSWDPWNYSINAEEGKVLYRRDIFAKRTPTAA
jgi:hypothetical protein